ncbi:flagellar biosynthesis protein FlhB [Fervidobacterium sp. 2310opik-2]|uniref:flagellar biosynthesis protein FlhB n=1 Tax=Fervidobacterium sp. 2310opik-2 TaxID=1755815 RepID=UPI0013E0C902|nr:flagellar biosynthesis protein FlhB [Fervidobacterium sp. 2310opik-2]KAF2962014.1 flagellar biosynthetic protein FlhB [Fervidobacterium sp. 2310opik-2]
MISKIEKFEPVKLSVNRIDRIDIQLFADPDKTEKATPRKRQKAREEGQVPISRELVSGLGFLFASMVFLLLGKRLIDALITSTQSVFEISDNDIRTLEDFIIYASQTFRPAFLVVAILVLGTALFSLIIGLLQTRFLFTFKPLKMDLNRLNPITGLKRMFSLRSLFELLKAILKLAIIGFVGYSVIKGNFDKVLLTVDSSLIDGTLIMWGVLSELIIKCGIALIVVSIADYYYSRYEYEQNIKMTKQEIKEEFKEIEGNPEIKRRQRQIMMQFAMHRMMQEVPKASVVITNPTHFACALKYDPEEDFAPKLVAKGVDKVALRIIDIARKNDVPIVRNPRLAREIYYSTELGDIIPEKLYKAVAEVLAYVYTLREGRIT